MPSIASIGFDGCYAHSVCSFQNIFQIANTHWRNKHANEDVQFHWETIADSLDPIVSSSGLRFLAETTFDSLPNFDLVIVPPIYFEDERTFTKRLGELRPLKDLLIDCHNRGQKIIAHCSASFLLAETGLLNGLTATTTWWLEKLFRMRYPKVHLDIEQLIIEHPGLICGGTSDANALIALRIVEQVMGERIAAQCGKTFLINTNVAKQTPYVLLKNQQEHGDPLVSSAQDWLQRNMDQAFSLDVLANHLSSSTRTLIRRFNNAINEPPNQYLQNLRMDAAKRLLENTNLPIDQIMLQIGYTDPSYFSRLFKKKTGMRPSAYRQHFQN